ncbi:MAG TPA: iron-sulfur cluster repair di-iron protein [Terriglobales bacterium]|nr:iron-sulfur cluster repair di-iron protein [Terriglobales bacterium]
MTLTLTKTVREYAIETPQTIPVFEKLGIDFCCGGNRPLEEVCASANLDIEDVLKSLENALAAPAAKSAKELQSGSLAELITHIEQTHHVFVRQEIPQIEKLLEKVHGKHGANHPELGHIRSVFHGLGQELMMHLMKEENILFPYIERMEESVMQREPILPPPFGTVANPVRMMEHEHDSAGNALKALREASHEYQPPADACTSFRALYTELENFEKDLHQHIHLENNVLFPRALQMENGS